MRGRHGPFAGDREAETANARIRGVLSDGVFGKTVEAMGDTDGDGLLEYAIGAPADEGGMHESAMYVFEGVLSGELLASEAEAVYPELAFAAHMGGAAAGGSDLDGDGMPDLVFAARREDNGAPEDDGSLHIRGLGRQEVRLTGSGSAGWRALSTSADIDGNGTRDLVIGYAGLEEAGVWRGGALVVAGANSSAR